VTACVEVAENMEKSRVVKGLRNVTKSLKSHGEGKSQSDRGERVIGSIGT